MSAPQEADSLVNIDPDRAVVVKNIPPGVSSCLLEDYLEVICKNDNEVEILYFHGGIRSIAVAQFESPIEDIHRLQTYARNRPLQNRDIIIEELGSVDGLLALELDEQSLTSEDCLSLYFERPSVGGEEDCVVEPLTIYKDLHMAVIVINNPTQVVPRILKYKGHQLNKKTFKVEPYFACFHDDVIKEMLKSDCATISSVQLDDEDYLVPQPSSNIQVKDERSASVKSEHVYEEIDNNYFEKKMSAPAADNKAQTPIKSGGNLRFLTSDQEEDKENFQKDTGPVPTVNVTVPRSDGFHPPPFSGIIDDVKPLSKNTKREKNLQRSQVFLLRVIGFDKHHPNCTVKLCDRGNVGIKISGDEEDVQQVYEVLLRKLQNIVQHRRQLTSEAYSFLQQRRKQSDHFMRKTLERIKAFVDFSDDDHTLIASAFSVGEAKRALSELCSVIGEREVDYTESCFNFLSSDEWKRLSSRLESQYGVTIKMKRQERKLVIYGSEEAIDSACGEVKQAVDRHSCVTGKPVVVTGGKARLFNHCLQSELQRLRDSIRKQGGNMDYKFDKGSKTFTINFKGNDGVVKETEKKVIQMLKSAWEGPVDLKRVARKGKDKEVTAMSKGILSSKGRELLLGFSKDNNCVIESEKDQIQSSVPYKPSPRRFREEEGELVYHQRAPTAAAPYSVKIKNTTVTVKQGNIAKEKASILVGMLGKKRRGFHETVVAKNFFKDGGQSISQDLEANYSGEEDVVMTTAGTLQCNHLCHMILDKFDDSGRVKAKIRKTFKDVYKLAADNRASSIAFPAIGTGRLLQYPVPYIAECMISEAVTAINSYNFQQITFVIYDTEMLPRFSQRLQTEISGAMPKPPPRTRSDVFVPPQKTPGPKSEDSYRLVADIKLFAISKDQGERLRTKLGDKMRTWFLSKEKIADECGEKIKNLSSENKKAIYQLTRGKPVEVDINFDKGQIKLIGEKEAVDEVSKGIYKILLKCNDVPKHRRHHNRETREFWVDLSHDPPYPKYWKSLQGKGILTGITDMFKKAVHWNGANIHSVDAKYFQAVESLVQKTFDPKFVGHGKDAMGLNHTSIKVTKIERIENCDLYHDYATKRQHFFRLLGDGQPHSKALENLGQQKKGAILSKQHTDKLLLSDLYQEINEHYFFHGTPPDMVDNIADKGLDPRHFSDNSMFGQGVYGAECFTKADQYADQQNKRQNTGRKVLLVRLILGNIFVANTPQKYKIPPCANCQKDKCTTAGHIPYDSVVGDGKWLFREFVVYEKQHCYPEYVITYDRL